MNSQLLTCKDKIKSKPQDSIPSFIRKTYDILEERKFPDIIDWNPEGTALVIKKPSDFCQKVLPAYFKHNNLTSFVRQLNMYNFHKKRTQNIDHVYSHDLFQRGQKQLLKEIKRKGHELNHNGLDKSSPKSSENFIESSQSPKDLPALCYENQILKRLYNEAMTKISKLESHVNDLSAQNQNLWSQICSGNQQQQTLTVRHEKSLTLEQLPMTFGDISIPPLKLSYEEPAKKVVPTANVNGFFSMATEDSGESTDDSHNSPSLQPSMESDKNFDMTDATPLTTSTEANFSLPPLSLTPQVSLAAQNMKSFGDLFASRGEMSMGQIFEAWNSEFQQENQKESTVLGKRQLETENISSVFQVPEPSMKRQEINLFIKKGLTSNGEDREFFRKMLGRNPSNANDDCDLSNLDLIEFSTAGWTKTA